MIQTPDGAAAPISMDNVWRRIYADNNRRAAGAVGLSARTSAAVEAAITSGAACGQSVWDAAVDERVRLLSKARVGVGWVHVTRAVSEVAL